jgi:hypothetical protein
VVRTDDNVYSTHGTAPDPLAVWNRIEQDFSRSRLPRSAELHVTDLQRIPADVRDRFEAIDMRYTYQSNAETVQRLRLATAIPTITTDDQRRALGTAVLAQITADHDKLRAGMVYTPPSTRDPCHGVFNHCFEVVMAFCYMLDDAHTKKLRAFGAFTANAGGDMQHFDYGHSSRA